MESRLVGDKEPGEPEMGIWNGIGHGSSSGIVVRGRKLNLDGEKMSPFVIQMGNIEPSVILGGALADV
jgi:hypothetical protein